MNLKQIIASLVVLTAAGSAFAAAPYPPEAPFKSTKTRADVQAELVEAHAQGLMSQSDANYPVLTPRTQNKANEQQRPVDAGTAKLDAKIYHGA
ncbi:MAG: DUF4148 domain-containing protein [Burkholderiales bacterium]|nr:DUF4148 domain-containing protein [Burkholderiales bacterium]